MPTTVATAVASRSRIEHARAWLQARGNAEKVVILGASLDAANEIARGMAKTNGAVFGWYRLTLAQLAASVALPALTDRGMVPLSPIGAEAMTVRLVHRLKSEGRIGRFGPIGDTPGLPRAIAGVITELRLAQLPPEALVSAAPDVAPLLSAYEAELAEMALIDWPGVLAHAAEDAGAHGFSGLPLLMLDVPVANAAELAFVRALATQAPEILATVPAADEWTLARLRDELRWPVEDLDLRPRSVPDARLNRLQHLLFKEAGSAAVGKPAASVEIFSAPGEGREGVEIARRVLSRAREGVPFDRIAILLRSPEEYRAHLEEAFDRAGIPVHFARGARRPDAAGRAFYALLKCAAEGLSARRFAEYLSLGQLPDAGADGTPPPAVPRGDRWVKPDSEAVTEEESAQDTERYPGETIGEGPAKADDPPVSAGQLRAPRHWEQLLVEAAVIGSRDRWRRRLDGLANELRIRLGELSDEEETEAAAVMRTLDDLAAFTAYALPIIDILDGWPPSANWGEWLDHLGSLATRALRHPDRVLSILAELAPMAPVGPVQLSEVIDVLGPLLLERAVPPPPQRYGKLFVSPVEAARGLSFDTVFVPGLAERMFPRKIVEEPILLDSFRRRISAGLATNQSRLENERLALVLAVGAAESRICFSYPRLDLEAQPRPRVPSFYALEALRATEGRLPDFTELARRAETATATRLGWPAPPNPKDAIDSAEHDLAILDQLAGARRHNAGAARYLITANPHLARALRARYQRWGKNWTASDGLVSRSATARAAMARHALAVRSYSPTALQTYARCPYRFFLYAIHRLAPRLEPERIDELDPLQRGSLIHDIQFALFARLRREALLPIRHGTLDRAQEELDAAIAEVAARYYDDLAPAIERVWLDGVAAIGADLREWLRRASLDESGFVPQHFELSFGLASRPSQREADPRSVPGAVDLDGGLQLRGSIDLVEGHPSGLLRVTDHKTGKFDGSPGQVIAGGTALQPLLYALAAEKLFAGQAEISCGRLYFCTSRGGFEALEVPLDDQARGAATQVADAIGGAVSRAFLPAYPAQDECTRCDYRLVCGPHEERRIARKPRTDMQALLMLRGAP
ncbi:MAG: PD-(D/E)XK nuclease family protein [Alphaproteobacteria bacterium]|nr:PD-(D/E)XK nuclease family protein [Alphaproteobacteria bacterium]